MKNKTDEVINLTEEIEKNKKGLEDLYEQYIRIETIYTNCLTSTEESYYCIDTNSTNLE